MNNDLKWMIGALLAMGTLLGTFLDSRIDDVRTEIQRVHDRLDGFDDRLDGFDDRLDGFDDRLRNVEIEFGKVDQRLATIERILLPGSAQPAGQAGAAP